MPFGVSLFFDVKQIITNTITTTASQAWSKVSKN